MQTIHSILDAVITFILLPFTRLAPEWGLISISILTGILLLLVYGRVSNQKAIKDAKRQIYANLLESILFRHDLWLSLSAQGRMFRQGIRYFLIAIPPILILAVPCIFILAQLNLRYGMRALELNEPVVVEARFDDATLLYQATLSAPDGVEVTPALRVDSEQKVYWRVTPKTTTTNTAITLAVAGKGELSAPLVIGEQRGPIYVGSYKDWWMGLLYPSIVDLSASAIPLRSLSIGYPEVDQQLWGMKMHWIVMFLVVSVVAGIFGSRWFGVEI